MAYQVLARRWRPQRFEDVVGQEHVTKTLANAIRTDRLAHSFLFSGPRGVGKTTAARILAKCLNCEKATDGPIVDPCGKCDTCMEIAQGRSLDVLEIDGASNRGIDEIRDLRENVRYAPSGGRAKVYIIDEVHMLTKEAFNALLKTLEEPPPGVYFVFATTEAHRVPATIRSRCQKYDFHRIPSELIAKTLGSLAKKEKFKIEPAALAELARQADGGLRDAQSLLDQAAAVGGGEVTLEGLRELLGEAEDDVYLAIVSAAARGETGEAFGKLQELLDKGMDPGRIAVSLTQVLRDVLVVQSAPDGGANLGVRADLVDAYRQVGEAISPTKLTAFLTLASRTVADLRRSARPRLTLEVALARLSRLEDPGEIASLVARLERLGGGSGGDDPSGPPARPVRPPAPSSPSAPRPSKESRPRHESRPAAAAPPTSPPPETPLAEASGAIERLWEDLVTRVRRRKVMLASFLEHGAPTRMDKETFTAIFESTYYEGMVNRRENLALIHEELAAAAGKALTLKVKLGQLPASRPRGATSSGSGASERARPKDLLKENPGLSRIIHDLGGQLLPGGGSSAGGGL